MPSGNDIVPPRRRRTPNFMTYPYPTDGECTRIMGHLEGVKSETRRCIANLLAYRATRTRARLPRGASAAVLVPLFVGRLGDVYVLLSRRSDALRAFAGDTALPGGRVDVLDETIEDAARREAFEEIGLPRDKERVPLLCVMEPHLAKGEILVTPVVVLILDHNLQPNLNSSEVTLIFAQPLISFLSSTPHLSGGRTADPSNPYYTFTDVPWSDDGTVRLHKFLTGREGEGVKPVFGVTSSILIKTATFGYGRTPDFELQPPNAPTPAQQIAYALLTPANPLRVACEREGIDANKAAARMLRPPVAANAARSIAWAKIGMRWKKFIQGGGLTDDHAQVIVQPGSSSVGSCPGGEKREEGKEREAEYQDAISNMETLGTLLDKTQDKINERMEEGEGDEKKLPKAKMYPEMVKQVEGDIENLFGEDGELDPKTLFSLSQEGPKGGIEAGRFQREKGDADDSGGERRSQNIEKGNIGMRKDLEETKYSGMGGPRKRDAKL